MYIPEGPTHAIRGDFICRNSRSIAFLI